MGFNDFFSFDEDEYAKRIADEDAYPTHRLKMQEVVKFRQAIGASCSIGGGIGAAHFTFGLSLLAAGYGGRRLYIARKKLKLIMQELERRGVSLHKPTKRDFFIPVGTVLFTASLGFGVDALAAHATSQVAAHVAADHGTRALSDVCQDSGAFCHGVGEGLTLQAHEIGNVFTSGLQHATAVSNWNSYYLVANVPYMNPGQVVGLAAGTSLAHVMELKLAKFASGRIGARVIKQMSTGGPQPFTTVLPPDCCRRRTNPPDVLSCNHCAALIYTKEESYFHCCECRATTTDRLDDYDACANCILSLHRGCENKVEHVLFRVPPRIKDDRICYRLSPSYVQAPISMVRCNHCKIPIARTDYYHCCACDEDFDICKNCYDEGKRCNDAQHDYFLFPEPRYNLFEHVSMESPPSWCKRSRNRLNSPRQLICKVCFIRFNTDEFAFLHCCLCDDDYDICLSCIPSGLQCKDQTHKMHLICPE